MGVGLFSDTVFTRDSGSSSWENIYKYFEDEGPRVKVRTVVVDKEVPTLEATPQDFLQRIAARPILMPYTDMIRWVVQNVKITK